MRKCGDKVDWPEEMGRFLSAGIGELEGREAVEEAIKLFEGDGLGAEKDRETYRRVGKFVFKEPGVGKDSEAIKAWNVLRGFNRQGSGQRHLEGAGRNPGRGGGPNV